MILQNEAVCPYCDITLEEDDCIDTFGVGQSENRIGHLKVGHCPNCDREFQWVEVYEYIGVKDLTEED